MTTTIPPAECQQVADRFRAAVEAVRDLPAHVQAEIDARRAMAEVRKFAADNRARIDAEWDALPNPPRRLAGHRAEVRCRVGEKRWREMVGEG